MTNLSNKNAFITGALGLLGIEHCNAILEKNGNVFALDKKDINQKFKYLINKYPKKITYFKIDITKEYSIKKLINRLKKQKISIDILINNAALNPKVTKSKKTNTFENFSENLWNKEISVGLLGSVLCTKYFGSEMIKKKNGKIINISSDLGIIGPFQKLYKEGFEKPLTYSIIKHGIIGLTKYTAATWGKFGININCLCPGGVEESNMDKKFLKKIKYIIPQGRMAKKDEYKGIIQFLSSDQSSYFNGSIIVADGGRTII